MGNLSHLPWQLCQPGILRVFSWIHTNTTLKSYLPPNRKPQRISLWNSRVKTYLKLGIFILSTLYDNHSPNIVNSNGKGIIYSHINTDTHICVYIFFYLHYLLCMFHRSWNYRGLYADIYQYVGRGCMYTNVCLVYGLTKGNCSDATFAFHN